MTANRRTEATREVISTCPVCSSQLAVTRLHCGSCGTSIEGEFQVGRFGRLNREQMAMLESFLRSRGNLRDMERELGLSYPTVRSRVDAMVRALGLGGADAGADEQVAGDRVGAAGEQVGEDNDARRADVVGDVDAESGVRAERRAILEQLARHEISATDAADAIRALGRARR
jgi:hypothetical protein